MKLRKCTLNTAETSDHHPRRSRGSAGGALGAGLVLEAPALHRLLDPHALQLLRLLHLQAGVRQARTLKTSKAHTRQPYTSFKQTLAAPLGFRDTWVINKLGTHADAITLSAYA